MEVPDVEGPTNQSRDERERADHGSGCAPPSPHFPSPARVHVGAETIRESTLLPGRSGKTIESGLTQQRSLRQTMIGFPRITPSQSEPAAAAALPDALAARNSAPQGLLTILPKPATLRADAPAPAVTRGSELEGTRRVEPAARAAGTGGAAVATVQVPAPRSETPERSVAPLHVASERRTHDAQTRLFRTEALAAYARGARAASVLRITSISRWGGLMAVGLLLTMAAAVTAFGRIEETSAARGILRAPFGVQSVVASVGGTVREVAVSAGDRVKAGDLIARIDATPLEAELQAAEQRLASIEREWNETRQTLRSTHAHAATLLSTRMSLLQQTRERQRGRIARRDALMARVQTPEVEQVIEDAVRDQRVEAVDSARDDLERVSQELSTLRLEAGTAYGSYRQALAAGEERVREARTKRDAVRVLLQQTELRAPTAGLIESLRSHPGQHVQAGDWVARVVRDEQPRTLVAFVPERDVAFLHVGAVAAVEVDQLPVGEFGHVDARVVRVAGELADRSELTAAFGESASTAPHVRVELELTDAANSARFRRYLRPGTLVTARIPLRERRLLAIVFEPARRWLD